MQPDTRPAIAAGVIVQDGSTSPRASSQPMSDHDGPLTKDDVREVLATYIKAWETQDPDLIITIFTPDATYWERVLEAPIPDREAIREYWQSKVVKDQANIRCELLNLYLDGDTAIAEWLAEFDDVVQGVRKRMKEIAVLDFRGRQICALREYWASERVDGA